MEFNQILKDKNKLFVSALFALSTLFFIIQHYFSLSWDFAAYVLNTKYLFYHGTYFEVYRAPLISIILYPLMIFGKFGEYLYLVLVSTLFFYSVKKLSHSLHEKYFASYKITKEFLFSVFYFFSLNIFLLFNGLNIGTELLALSFFQLFLSKFINNENSGHYLALAVLSRYNFLLFAIFLLFNKNYKKILKNLGLFLLVLSPWLIFNAVKFGNFLQSVVDSYYLNIFARKALVESMSWEQFLLVFNIFIPFAILGVVYSFFSNKKKLAPLFMLLLGIIFFLDFYNTPFKITRYLFNLCLPIAFFSTIGFLFLYLKFPNPKNSPILPLLIFTIIISLLVGYFANGSIHDKPYFEAAQKLDSLGLKECYFLSPHWVPINYYNERGYFLSTDIATAISQNKLVVIFPSNPTYDDYYVLEDLGQYPTIFKNKELTIFAKIGITNNTCEKWPGYDVPLVPNPCEVISGRFGSLNESVYSLCRVVNAN